MQLVRAGAFGLAAAQRADLAEQHRAQLDFGIGVRVDRPEHEFAQRGTDQSGAMAPHQNHPVRAERLCQRLAFLRLDHQHVGVAEFVSAVPEWRRRAEHRAHVEHRHELDAGDAERQDRRRVMVADRVDVGPRLVDAAMDHALAIKRHALCRDRLGVERELEDVRGLDQLGAARTGEQIAAGIGRMAHADMAESIQHAFMRDDAVGERQLVAGFGEGAGHACFLSWLARRHSAVRRARRCQ